MDFKIGDKYIEVIDSKSDIDKFNNICKNQPDLDIVGIGHSDM